jgi:WD40 repeat protein
MTPDASGGLLSSSVAFSPDGATVVEGWNKDRYTERGEFLSAATYLSFLDVGAGRERARIVLPADETCAVAFSPDGRTLAVGLSAEVKLYDAMTGRERHSLKTEEGFYFNQLAYSADGQRLAAAGASSVIVWETASNRVVFSPRANARMVYGVAISPDGEFVAAAGEGPMVCRPIGLFGLSGVSCTADGGRVMFWGPDADPNGREFKEESPSYAVALSPDGRTLASGG